MSQTCQEATYAVQQIGRWPAGVVECVVLPSARPRQYDPEFGELSGLCLDLDRAAMLFYDDVVTHRQPKSGAFARRLGREKRVEYFLFDLVRNSGAVVANANFDFVTEILCRSGQRRFEAVTGFRPRVSFVA